MLKDGIKIYVTSFSEEVTGSNNHVKVEWPDGRRVSFIVDCGLFQEKEYVDKNSQPFPYKMENISFAIATHAHTDHIGRFPYLVKCGFEGPIFTSYETSVIMPTVLSETADRLQDEYRNDFKNYKLAKEIKKRSICSEKGRGKKDKPRRCKCLKKSAKKVTDVKIPVLIYEKDDISRTMQCVVSKSLNDTFSPCCGIEITFYPNAHIGGAVLTVFKVFDNDEEIYLLFTGDLGLTNPITNVETFIPDEICNKIDIIVSESTYGSAEYSKNILKQREKHKKIIKDVCSKSGTIFYMSNSLERPLVLLNDLKNMQSEEEITKYVNAFDIFFDSTFGIKCYNKYTKLYGKDYLPKNFEIIDKDTRDMAILSPNLKMVVCTSPRFYQGSFLNYGKRYLEDPNVTLIFVAYIPEEVRNVMDLPYGSQIQFNGEMVTLRCKMHQFGYYSSHVSTEEMDSFLSKFKYANTLLFNHGTHDAKASYLNRYKTESNVTHDLLYGRTVLITKCGIKKYF